MSLKFKPWLRLIRVPNLFTVPGDPLAGALLAGATLGMLPNWKNAVLAVLGSLMLYAAGLIDNDLADLKEDRRDRPGRPLPAGEIKVLHAILSAGAAFAIGLVVAGLIGLECLAVAAGLAICVLLYNHLLKRVPVIGPVAMGLCRGLSVMLGASVLGRGGLFALPAVLAAGLITVYIAAVTGIAAGETTGRPVGRLRNLPAMVLAFYFALAGSVVIGEIQSAVVEGVSFWKSTHLMIFLALGLVSVVVAGMVAIRLGGTPEPSVVQRTIGEFIRNLMVIQAAMCCVLPPEGLYVAVALLAAWPISGIVGRWFYAS